MSTNDADNRISTNDEFWQALFTANTVAVIGATEKAGSWGFNVLTALKRLQEKVTGRSIYAVNPMRTEILGVTCYRSVRDIPGDVSLAIIVIPAERVPQALTECAEKKVKATIIISAGFAESDEAGAKLEAELVRIANDTGTTFVGPNCVGHADLYSSLGSIGFGPSIKPGPMAVVAQSGTVGVEIASTASRMGIGISKFLSTGNEANQHLEDFVEFLAHDEHTRVIAAYVEGLREGRRFVRLAREITPRKPIIVLKAGGTKDSAIAARSHTGSLTGSAEVYAAAFKQCGVIQVDDIDEIADLAMLLLHQPLPKGNRVGIVTMGGGLGVIAAEAVEKEGLTLARLNPSSIEKISAVLPSRWSHSNPVDTAGVVNRPGHQTAIILSCIAALMEDANVDVVACLTSPLVVTSGPHYHLDAEHAAAARESNSTILETLERSIREYRKPLLVYDRSTLLQSPEDEFSPLSLYRRSGIPVYGNVRHAARIIRYLVWYQKYLESRAYLSG